MEKSQSKNTGRLIEIAIVVFVLLTTAILAVHLVASVFVMLDKPSAMDDGSIRPADAPPESTLAPAPTYDAGDSPFSDA